MKKIFYLLIFLLIISTTTYAQNGRSNYQNANITTLGLGLGLTYGGIGTKVAHNFSEGFGIMAGLGYNFVGLAYNVGTQVFFPSKKRAQIYLSAMYGTNGVIIIQDAYSGDHKKSYYGMSFGFGVNLKSKRTKGNYWEFGLIVPIHGSDFNDTWDDIKQNPVIETQNDPLPVLLNIGYNFNLN